MREPSYEFGQRLLTAPASRRPRLPAVPSSGVITSLAVVLQRNNARLRTLRLFELRHPAEWGPNALSRRS